jgi:hypothetical protein
LKILNIDIERLDSESLNIRSDNKLNIKYLDFEDLIIDKNFKETPTIHFIAYSIIRYGFDLPIAVYEDSEGKYKLLQDDKNVYAIYLLLNRKALNYYINEQRYIIPTLIKEKFRKIQCIVYSKPNNEKELLLLQIAASINKSNNNFELTDNYNRLIDEFGLKQTELSKMLGKTKQAVSDIVRLKYINPDIKKLLEEIQLFGYSEKKLEKYNSMYFKSKNIGIQALRKIADSDNQVVEFWYQFGERCSYDDAEFIGLTIAQAKEIEKQKENNYFIPVLEEYIKILKKIRKANITSKETLELKKNSLAHQLMPEFIRENNFDEKYLLSVIKQEVNL